MNLAFTGTALITGGTSGLGYHAARFIAQERPDWQVLIASRGSGLNIANRINAQLKTSTQDRQRQANVFWLPLDLSCKQSVRRFASSYTSSDLPPLRALVLNAGIQVVSGVRYSVDGEELTYATNHTGHALLFALLQRHLTNDAHIISVSSGVHDPKRKSGMTPPEYTSAEKCAHPDQFPGWDTPQQGRRRYALSKLVNVLWTYALRRRARLAGKGWKIAAMTPGERQKADANKEYLDSLIDPFLPSGRSYARHWPSTGLYSYL
jgi:NAD(P)-dependent dehydrogenase (short-subunit alcohol dehydrogenase family)